MRPVCWIYGPGAWDWVHELPYMPAPGGFVQATRSYGREGGSGANVARALAKTGVPVHMIGYVGGDEFGTRLTQALVGDGVDVESVARLDDGPTSQVLLFVDDAGDRTIVGIVDDRLAEIEVPINHLNAGDVLFFAAVHSRLSDAACEAVARGVTTVSVPFDVTNPMPVDLVVGSLTQLPPSARNDPFGTYHRVTGGRLTAAIITHGVRGAVAYTGDGAHKTPARRVGAVDETGAGDAFAAGMLRAIVRGEGLDQGVRDGIIWGAAACTVRDSVPPAFPTGSQTLDEDAAS